MKRVNKYNDSAELFLQFAHGDREAFAAIYDQFYDRVYGFARRWLPEPHDAEDITADIFLKLWERRDSFSSIENLGAFLFIMVRNACINVLQQSQVKHQKRDDIRRQLEETHELDFANMQIRAEFLKMVYAEAEKLPGKMKTIFLLSYRDGLKPAEIAEKLELSVQTVKNQKLNAIRLLRIALADSPLMLAFLLYLEVHSTGYSTWSA